MRHIVQGVVKNQSFHQSVHMKAGMDWLYIKLKRANPRTIVLIRDPFRQIRIQAMFLKGEGGAMLHESANYSDPQTVPGRLSAGNWMVEIHGTDGEFELDWQSGAGDLPHQLATAHKVNDSTEFWTTLHNGEHSMHLGKYDMQRQIIEGKRWYKGDFHAHTIHSDGKMTPLELNKQAAAQGLDFFAVTDHNLLPTGWPKDHALLVLPGIEISSKRNGHMNLLGLQSLVEWHAGSDDGGMDTECGMKRIMHQAKECGAVVSINHPLLMHWSWTFRESLLQHIDALEIWNDPTYPQNKAATEKSLQLWDALLNEGYRITGIGGSDVHNLPHDRYEEGGEPSLVGDPATYVYADGLSAAHLLEAVRKGHVFVSRGPLLECKVSGKRDVFGDHLGSERWHEWQTGANVQLELEVRDAPSGATLHWIENGMRHIPVLLSKDERYKFDFTIGQKGWRWLRVEIRAATGELLAFSNPLISGSKVPKMQTWGELMDKYSHFWS